MARRNPESLKHKVGIGIKNSRKKKQITTVRKKTGERELFDLCRNTRPHICGVCKKYFDPIYTYCFAHVLSKFLYPKQRLNLNNIILVCSIVCHHELDRKVTGHKRQILDILELGGSYKDVLNYINKHSDKDNS